MVILGPTHRPYSVRNVNASLNEVLKKLVYWYKEERKCHTIPHSFATHLLEHGTGLRYIQNLLGHESSRTTERYTHITKKGLDRIISPLYYLLSKENSTDEQ